MQCAPLHYRLQKGCAKKLAEMKPKNTNDEVHDYSAFTSIHSSMFFASLSNGPGHLNLKGMAGFQATWRNDSRAMLQALYKLQGQGCARSREVAGCRGSKAHLELRQGTAKLSGFQNQNSHQSTCKLHPSLTNTPPWSPKAKCKQCPITLAPSQTGTGKPCVSWPAGIMA